MAANPQTPQQPKPALNAGIQKTKVFGKFNTFQDVIDLNPDFETWKPEERNELAGKFFQEKYGDFSPQEQLETKIEFNKKYNVGQLQNVNPVQAGVEMLNLGLGSVLDPTIDAYTFGGTNFKQSAEQFSQKQFPGIETDPGLLGETYRFHKSNPIPQSIGNVLGAFSGANTIAQALPKALPKLAQNASVAGIYSGLSQIPALFRGQQDAIGALTQVPIDTLAGLLPGGKTKVSNAIKQGLGGGVAAGVSNIAQALNHGQEINVQELLKEIIHGGSLGAGVGAAFHSSTPSAVQRRAPIKIKTRNVNDALDQATLIKDAKNLPAAIRKRQQEILDTNAVTERKAYEERLSNLNNLYKQMRGLESAGKPLVSKRAGLLKAEIQKEYQRVQAEKEQKFPSKKSSNSQKAKKTIPQGKHEPIITLGVKALKEGGATKARFKEILKGYTREDQYRVNKGIEARLKKEKEVAETEAERKDLRREAGKAKVKTIKEAKKEELKKKKEELAAQIKAEKEKLAKVRAEEKAIKEKLRKQKSENKDAQSLLKAVIDATKTPEAKTGTTNEYTASGPDEYAEMAKHAEKLTKEAKALQASIEAKQKAHDKTAQQLLDAIAEATKTPETKTGTTNEYTASGPDEYARLARENKVKELKAKSAEKGYEPAQSQEGMSKLLAKAKKDNTIALIEYEAQIHGERESSTYKSKTDTVISSPYTDNSGKLVYKVINENGQKTTRHINDPEQGSRTLSVTMTDEPAPYHLDENGQVIETKTGRVIEQVKENMVKSSEIRSTLEQTDAFNRTLRKFTQKKARVGDIVKASKNIDDTTLENQYKDSKPEARKDIHNKTTGDDC